MSNIEFDGIQIDVETVRAKLAAHDAGPRPFLTPSGAEVIVGYQPGNIGLDGYSPIGGPTFQAKLSSEKVQLINNSNNCVWLQCTRRTFGAHMTATNLQQLIEVCQEAIKYLDD